MINVYDGDDANVEPHPVNGRNGFVIRIGSEADGDEIFFEDYATLRSFVQEIDEQSASLAPLGGEA